MRIMFAVGIVAIAALASGPALAADIPQPPPIYTVPDLPPVDYGLGGFYLRGSLGADLWYAKDGAYCGCITDIDAPGWGGSAGVGFGYETGDGLRADVTLDYLHINGLHSEADYTASLRSGLALANLYYDVNVDGGYGASGGTSVYFGAGIGGAYNYSQIYDDGGAEVAWGTGFEAAAAVMAGVSYDMGTMVADLGYRGIWMDKVMSQPPLPADSYIINGNWIHELRASLRYRLD